MKRLVFCFFGILLSFVFCFGYSFSKSIDEMTENELKELNQTLMSKLEKLEAANEALVLRKASIEEDYQQLLQDSPECAGFQTKYKEMLQQNEDLTSRLEHMRGSMESDPKFWFLIGPGVFIVGLLFGLSSRKKKRSGLL